jgi:hypothetical protein
MAFPRMSHRLFVSRPKMRFRMTDSARDGKQRAWARREESESKEGRQAGEKPK